MARTKTASTEDVPPRDTPRGDESRADAEFDGLDPSAAIATFIAALDAGEPWYDALLATIARWAAPDEVVDGVRWEYLIGGEAFDWLLLAQRLLDAVGARVPEEEASRLLFTGRGPLGRDDEAAFAEALGAMKYRGHLNFQYGVVVEEVILLAAEADLLKAHAIDGVRADIAAYERVYGITLRELQARYLSDTARPLRGQVRQAEWRAFTYWCSQYRLKHSEPARLASDTRKGLALLTRMGAEAARRWADREPEAVPIEVR